MNSSSLLSIDDFLIILENDNSVYGYVYLITNLENGKIYVGQSKRLSSKHIRTYFGSGKIITQVDNNKCVKEILKYTNNSIELNDWEEFYIHFYMSTNEAIGYNISKSVSYYDKRNLAGQNNPASSTNMSEYNRIKKAYKGVKTRKANILSNGLSMQDDMINRAVATKVNTINTLTGLNIYQQAAQKTHNTQLIRGTKSIRIANMMKTKIATGSFAIGAKKTAETIRRTGVLAGAKHPKAKKYVMISPTGEIFIINGEMKKFTTEHQLQTRLLLQFLGKGKVYLKSQQFTSVKSYNTIGWEIKNAE